MNTHELHLKKLIEALKLLLATESQRSALFESFVDVEFEVLDTYRNAFLLIPELIESSYLSFSQIADLIRINNLVSIAISKIDSVETSEISDFNSNHYASIASLTEKVLESFGEKKTAFTLDPRYI